MTTESILLVGRGSDAVRDVLDTHADRLESRTDVEVVDVAVYEHEPLRELRETLDGLDAETVYVVPMCVAHTYDTLSEIPAALSYISGTVRYCEPLGGSPAITDVLAERGRSADPEDILVAFGVLDSGVWWYRAEREKLICTLRDAGAPVGVEPT